MRRAGELVIHIDTQAEGEVVQGGFWPRVRWANNRVSRVDADKLRVTGYDDFLERLARA